VERRATLAAAAAALGFALTGCGGSGHSSAYSDGFSAGQNLEHTAGQNAGPSRTACAKAESINRNQSSDNQSSSSSSTKSDYVAGCLAGWKDAAGSNS
jgi:hypothetical protein